MEGSAAPHVGPEDGPAPGGIPPSRLAWLCQPERIERIIYLLFSLNHWAKARERLPFADLQELYRVKYLTPERRGLVNCWELYPRLLQART